MPQLLKTSLLKANLMHKDFGKFVSQIKQFPATNRGISGLQCLYIYCKDKAEKLLRDFISS